MTNRFRKLNRQAGFTLAETLLAVAIVIILSLTAIFSVASYRRSLCQIQLDSAAKELFIAAQNHLAMADSQGFLNRSDFGTKEADDRNIYYFVTGADEEGYTGVEDSDSILGLMLPFASIDEAVRTEGSFIIRYQAEPAQVLDVFYSTTACEYPHVLAPDEYATLMENYTGSEKKSDRRSYGDDKAVIGYYGGVEALSLTRGEELEAPSVRLVNGDRLLAQISNPNGADGDLNLVVTGTESGTQKVIPLIQNLLPVNGGNVTAEGWSSFSVVLDDITVDGFHFSELFPGFYPGEDITAEVIAFNNSEYTNVASSGTVKANSLFGALDDEAVQIDSFRHLENLDPAVSSLSSSITVSGAVQNTDLIWGEGDVFSPAVKVWSADGSCSGAGCFVPVCPRGALAYDGNDHIVDGLTVSCAGSAGMFGALNEGSSVSALELVDFDIYSTSGNAGALAGICTGTEISGVLCHNDNSADDSDYEITAAGNGAAGGLVGKMSGGSISMSAASVYVRSSGVAGGLVGHITGSADISCSYSGGHTLNARYTDELEGAGRFNVIGGSTAGGLIGKAEGSSFGISTCYSTCSCTASVPGGLVGTAQGGSISDCYCAGRTAATDDSAVGGFVGSISGTSFGGDSYYLSNVSDNIRAEVLANVTAVSGADTGYPAFIVPEESRTAADVYDDALVTSFLGKYYFPTISQMKSSAITEGITDRHIGDWQIPSLETVPFTVFNGDTLSLNITLEDEPSLITVAISGQASGVTRIFQLKLAADGSSAAVLNDGHINATQNIIWDYTDGNDVPYLPITVSDDGIDIVLDDITTPGRHFDELFCSSDKPQRNLLPGENIAVRVYPDNTSWAKLRQTEAVTENSLFAVSSSAIGEANLRYIRHLQNLDPVISNVSEQVCSANLLLNMTWSDKKYPVIYNSDSTKSISDGFYGIYNSNLTAFNGNNHILSGFNISSAPNSFSAHGAGNAGLFRLVSNGMHLEKVELKDFTVTAACHAGTAIAEVKSSGATIDTVLAASEKLKVQSTGSVQYSAGGLVGQSDGALTINNSAGSVYVKAAGPAGGVLGNSLGTTKITASYAAGHTNGKSRYDITGSSYNVTSTDGSAGGLVGSAGSGSLSIERSFGAASVWTGSTNSAGGLIGYAGIPAKLDTVYTIAPVSNVDIGGSVTNTFSGAFIGHVKDGVTVNNDSTYYLPEVYEGGIIAGDYSTVAYIGQGSLANRVLLANYEKDGNNNIISAKISGDTMQVKTYAYDSSLKKNSSGSTHEFPFSLWTSFSFDKVRSSKSATRTYGTYYGDWQPILSPATVFHPVSFMYKNPVSGEVQEISDTSLGTQYVVEGMANSLILPNLNNLAGWAVDHWELYEADGSGSPYILEDINGFIAIPAVYCDRELRAVAVLKQSDKFTVSFFYDPTGLNSSFQQIGSPQLVSEGTLMSEVKVPSRNIAGYSFAGWYYDTTFSQEQRAVFDGTEITHAVKVYAKYSPIEYYTITIDFMYQIDDGESYHLNTVPTYRIDDERSQYKIKQIKGTPFNDDILLPIFSNYSSNDITVDHYEGDTAGSISLSSDNRYIHVDADTDAHFIVIYHVDSGSSTVDTYTYKVMYRMHHTAANSTADNLKYASAYDTVYSYPRYGSSIFSAPVGTIPDIATENLAGFIRKTTSGGIILENAPSGSGCDKVIYIDYDRRMYTLTFKSQAGSYVEPTMLYYGQPLSSSKPSDPTRQGYTFTGWTINKAGSDSVSYSWSDAMPAANVTATATWQPGYASYRVMFWYENPDDSGYSYVSSKIGTALIGSTVRSADFAGSSEIDAEHFTYNSARAEEVTVKGNGSTVLNVYFTRNTYTLKFVWKGKCLLKAHTHSQDDCYDMTCELDVHTHTNACYNITCGHEEHSHTNACYSDAFICGKTEHTHTASCYGYVCGKTEHVHSASCLRCAHTHDISCYGVSQTTTPDKNRTSGMKDLTGGFVSGYIYYWGGGVLGEHFYLYYNGNFYTASSSNCGDRLGTSGGGLFCRYSYYEPVIRCTHTHNSSCYICGMTEHTHINSCTGLICGKETHTHSNACRELICGKAVHTHTGACRTLICGETGHVHSFPECYTLTCTEPEHTHNSSCNSTSSTNTVFQITAKYEANIKSIFPIVSGDGSKIFEGYAWKDSTGAVFSKPLQTLDIMPGANITFTASERGTAKTIYYYVEAVDGGSYDKEFTFNGVTKRFILYKTAKHDFNYITRDEEFHLIDGYTRYVYEDYGKYYLFADHPNETRYDFTSDNTNELYYTRNRSELEFYVEGISGPVKTESLQYEAPLSAYAGFVPERPNEQYSGFTFVGWYQDPGCVAEFDFESKTMPIGNLAVYGKWLPPQHTISFYSDNVSTYPLYQFTVTHEENIGDQIADAAGNLLEALIPQREGWEFDGWYYMDGTTERQFIYSQGILSDMRVYAKWTDITIPVSTETRDVTVRYVYVDGAGVEHQIHEDTTISEQPVDTTIIIRAEEIEGYYAESMVWYHLVTDDDGQVVTLNYFKIEPWQYSVEYYACFSSYEDDDGVLSEYSIEQEGEGFNYLISRVDNLNAYSRYESISFALPAGYESYHLNHYEYLDEEGTATSVTIHPDSDDTAIIRYYLEPDPSKIVMQDVSTVYDGTSKAIAEETDTVNTFPVPAGVTLEIKNVYRYYDNDGTALPAGDVVDVGVYKLDSYVVIDITGQAQGESESTTHSFLLWKNNTKSASLRILKRSVVLTSASACALYDADSWLVRSNPETDITISGDGFIGDDGVDISFSVESFRLDPGSTENVFSYTLKEGTNPDNYQISTVYGLLTIFESWDCRIEYYIIEPEPEAEANAPGPVNNEPINSEPEASDDETEPKPEAVSSKTETENDEPTSGGNEPVNSEPESAGNETEREPDFIMTVSFETADASLSFVLPEDLVLPEGIYGYAFHHYEYGDVTEGETLPMTVHMDKNFGATVKFYIIAITEPLEEPTEQPEPGSQANSAPSPIQDSNTQSSSDTDAAPAPAPEAQTSPTNSESEPVDDRRSFD